MAFSIYSLRPTCYVDDTVLMVDSKRKKKEISDIVKEIKNIGQTINTKKTENIVIRKVVSPRCRPHIRDIKIKQVHKSSPRY